MATAAKNPAAKNAAPKATRAALKPDAELAVDSSGPKVDVTVPRGFNLQRDDGVTVRYNAGQYQMPKADAEHWYSQANGVTID